MAIQHLANIIIPYFGAIPEELGLPEDQKFLLINDVFKAQTTEKYREQPDESNIAHVQVPPNLTHIFQRLTSTSRIRKIISEIAVPWRR